MSHRHPIGQTQRAILNRLRPGDWVRGADLVRVIGKPRNQVWHAIERLRARGYDITSDGPGQASRGYQLSKGAGRAQQAAR